jgi:hypothetical protein
MPKIGLIGLLQSRKATMCLLLLIASFIALMLGRMDGTAFGVVAGVIATIYNASHAYQQTQLPPRGQL